MNVMKHSGVKISELTDCRYISLITPHAGSIINGLLISGIMYSAKYDDQKINLVYSSQDDDRVSSVILKAKKDGAKDIERLQKDSGSTDEYLSLIPEIAEVMGMSIASIMAKPLEIQLNLAQAYVTYWFCDKMTITQELRKVSELEYIKADEVSLDTTFKHDLQQQTDETKKGDILHNLHNTEEQLLHRRKNMIIQEKRQADTNFNLIALHREIDKVRERSSNIAQKSLFGADEKVLSNK